MKTKNCIVVVCSIIFINNTGKKFEKPIDCHLGG